ncbi:BnaA10g06350D [Brassica napus]|uniref:BnaA10g06350D protein n=1 Tax=Brassica napus TaxID=3708 RepID=A0A078IM67_BRANA|nr:BnaA10g06350D [Brassica napus]
MAQVVATRSIQGSMLAPNGGSLMSTRSDKFLKLASFGVKVLGNEAKRSGRVSLKSRRVVDTSVRSSARVETQVVPVTPEAVPNGPEVRSGDLPQPIMLDPGQEFTFTIERGVSTPTCVSVNYDDFVNDVEAGDMLLVDGGMMSFMVKSKTKDCQM